MAFLNKALVDEKSGFGFHYSNALLFMQMIFTVGLFQLLKLFGLLTFTHPMPAAHPTLGRTGGLLLRLAPISTFYCINALGGMLSLQGLSLPMYSVLKRATPIIVAVLEYVWFHRTSTRLVITSLALCMSGFVLAGLGDLVFDANAYGLALLSCGSQAMYLLQVDKIGRELQMNSHELLYYNSLISMFILTPVVLLTGELHQSLFVYNRWSDPIFLICLLLMLFFGMSLNGLQFLCTQTNSPLTTCMVGVIKGILTTVGGFFVFEGQPVTFLNLVGVSLNTTGGALYAYAKYDEKQQSRLATRIGGSKPLIEIPQSRGSEDHSPQVPLLPHLEMRTN